MTAMTELASFFEIQIVRITFSVLNVLEQPREGLTTKAQAPGEDNYNRNIEYFLFIVFAPKYSIETVFGSR